MSPVETTSPSIGLPFIRRILGAARAGKPLRVVADQIGSPTYTFHLAEATFDVLDERMKDREWVAGGVTRTLLEESTVPLLLAH